MKRTIAVHGRQIEYILIQTQRSNVLFQALPEGITRVYAPRHVRLKDVDEMVRNRISELDEMHRTVDQRLAEDRRNHPVTDGSTIMIEGKAYRLKLTVGKPIQGQIQGDCLCLTLPETDSDVMVRSAIRSVLSMRALIRIRERVDYYAPRIQVQYGRITIRNQKSRWGSCSSWGNLNFNWKLIMAPPEVLDYVVIHELCHRIEFNHSERFWKLVYQQMPDYEAWKKWLKSHSVDLFL